MRTTRLNIIALALLIPSAASWAGPRDSGGGNTLNGKPIEAYQQDVTLLPVYKTAVAPVVAQVQAKLPEFGQELANAATQKPWYFVPVHLEELPSSTTGLDFSSDQTALQSKHAIWIDQQRFGVLAESDQSLLILHELVMASYWLRNDTINANAHDEVRSITDFILNQSATRTPSEIGAFLLNNGFPAYEAALDLTQYPEFTLEQYYDFVQELLNTGKLPQHRDIPPDPANYFDYFYGYCSVSLFWEPVFQKLTVSAAYVSEDQMKQPVPNTDESGMDNDRPVALETANQPTRQLISPYEVQYMLSDGFTQSTLTITADQGVTDFAIGKMDCVQN